MTRRYYVPQLPSEAGELRLPPEEARHAAAVMRIRPGDEIVLFDGQDNEAHARVTTVKKREVVCSADAARRLSREPSSHLTACVAIPKGDRSRMLVEKLTEFGVARLVPLICQRSPWKIGTAAMEKLGRHVIEACKQSGRNRLMVLETPVESSVFFQENEDMARACDRLIAHPHGPSVLPLPGAGRPIAFAIGPEGGFTDAELELADRADWRRMSLGPRIYRVETAAFALAARLLTD
ncbi:MAG: RsmE family RNA methyltransferase [Pirellulaceae bacterium]